MKRLILGLTATAVLATSSAALAVPGVPKVTINTTDKITPSTKFTPALALQKKKDFSLTKTYKTASGGTITGQQFLDVANKLQGAAEKGGCDLGSGKPCNFMHSDAKLTAAHLNQTAKVAGYVLTLKKVTPSASSTSSNAKAKDPLGFSWSQEWGNHATGAVYVSAEFGNSGTASSTSCGGNASAGVYLFNHKKEVVRLEGEGDSSGTKVSGSAELFVLGDSVWSKSGTFSTDKLKFEKTFSISESFSYWGLVTLNLSAKVTGSAYVLGGLSGVAKTGEFTCKLDITPGIKASVGASAEVAILGYGPVSAGAVGVEANLTLVDLSVPISASVTAKNTNNKVSFSESLSVDLDMTYLKGSLDAYFKTNIPIDGEKIWDWDTDKFTFTLLEWDGTTYNKSLYKKTQTQTL